MLLLVSTAYANHDIASLKPNVSVLLQRVLYLLEYFLVKAALERVLHLDRNLFARRLDTVYREQNVGVDVLPDLFLPFLDADFVTGMQLNLYL